MKQIKKLNPKTLNLKPKTYNLTPNNGQVMLLTVVILGGIMLGATTIAGLLMLYQIRQSTDIANSTKAIFAADAGIELSLYQWFKSPGGGYIIPTFEEFRDTDGSILATFYTTSTGPNTIKSVGQAGNSFRAFELRFLTPPQCSDGLDNDGDGFTDFPNDPECSDLNDNDESS